MTISLQVGVKSEQLLPTGRHPGIDGSKVLGNDFVKLQLQLGRKALVLVHCRTLVATIPERL